MLYLHESAQWRGERPEARITDECTLEQHARRVALPGTLDTTDDTGELRVGVDEQRRRLGRGGKTWRALLDDAAVERELWGSAWRQEGDRIAGEDRRGRVGVCERGRCDVRAELEQGGVVGERVLIPTMLERGVLASVRAWLHWQATSRPGMRRWICRP
jgi:hypothetical protein